MWYKNLDPLTKNRVKNLIRRGQLSFANGGWCMHDEAASRMTLLLGFPNLLSH
jgi:alpha-mannosidase